MNGQVVPFDKCQVKTLASNRIGEGIPSERKSCNVNVIDPANR